MQTTAHNCWELLSFVMGLIQAHANAVQKADKRAILGLFSPHFTLNVTSNLFVVSIYEAKQSRLQAATIGGGVRASKKIRKRRFQKGQKLRAFAYLHQWLRSRYAVKVGDPSSNKLQRIDTS